MAYANFQPPNVVVTAAAVLQKGKEQNYGINEDKICLLETKNDEKRFSKSTLIFKNYFSYKFFLLDLINFGW